MEAITIRAIRNQLQMTKKHMVKELDISFAQLIDGRMGGQSQAVRLKKALIDLCQRNNLNSSPIIRLTSEKGAGNIFRVIV